jgi:hypothetical protein
MAVSGTKLCKLLFHAIQSHLHQRIVFPPFGFLGLEISTATAESGWGLGFVYIISLFTFESTVALFLQVLKYLSDSIWLRWSI